jgi:hypothetical protein
MNEMFISLCQFAVCVVYVAALHVSFCQPAQQVLQPQPIECGRYYERVNA